MKALYRPLIIQGFSLCETKTASLLFWCRAKKHQGAAALKLSPLGRLPAKPGGFAISPANLKIRSRYFKGFNNCYILL